MPTVNFRQVEAPEIRKSGEGRKMTFVASDGTRDSAGTVLNVDGWDLTRFNKNGIIGYQHKVYGGWDDTENPDNIIGKGHAYVEDRKLMVDVEFEPEGMNELADKVYRKLEFGTLRAVSVGFMPVGKGSWGKGEEAVGGKRETYYYAGQELLEVSVVNIPANPNALKKGFEALDEEIAQLRREAVQDPEPEPVKNIEPVAEPEPEEKGLSELEKLQVRARLSIAGAALL